jgi:carbonic anhydrase
MRLFEAIIDANHRALAGDAQAGLHPADFADEFPIVALTCIDPRLNPLLPQVLGVPQEYFIWVRNAGNVVTGPLSSTMRSLALGCAVRGGKEIAIIGHTDCLMGKTTTQQMVELFREIGVDRQRLPENANEYFAAFASERANVIKAAQMARQSPIIGPKIPVHGLLVDIETGKLEWLVNGYQDLEMMGAQAKGAAANLGMPGTLGDFNIGEMKFPESKIGDAGTRTEELLAHQDQQLHLSSPATTPAAAPAVPPRIPLPPPIRPRLNVRKSR